MTVINRLLKSLIYLTSIFLLGFGFYQLAASYDSEMSLDQFVQSFPTGKPKEKIQLTDIAKKTKAKLLFPRFQGTTVDSTFKIEGIIEKTNQLSMPYIWAQVDFLGERNSSFHYYIPVENRQFSQKIQLFAGKGDYKVTLRMSSAEDKEQFLALATFQIHNKNASIQKDIEYSLHAKEKQLVISDPYTGYQRKSKFFKLSGTVADHQVGKLLVQIKKGDQVWKRTIATRQGRFIDKLPLLFGKGVHEVKVMVPSKQKNYFIDGATFYLDNTYSNYFQPIRYTPLYHERGIQLTSPLTSGDHTDLYTTISGSIERTAPYAMRTSNLIVQTVKGKEKATYFIPVKKFRFNDSIPFRFGPGKYEVTLFVPDFENKNRDYFRFFNVATFYVTSHVKKDYRHLLKSRGIQPENPQIQALAKKITRDSQSNRQKARAIFRYVATSMNYDMYKLHNDSFEWDDSAIKSLRTKKGVCQDYVFLALSLLRSVDIPSRFVEGEAGNQRHAWIEVLIDGKWITMDPTWGSGYITPEGRFTKRYDERYFDPPVDFFDKTHRRTGVIY